MFSIRRVIDLDVAYDVEDMSLMGWIKDRVIGHYLWDLSNSPGTYDQSTKPDIPLGLYLMESIKRN